MDLEQPPWKRTQTSTTSMTGNRVVGISKPLGTAQASAIQVTQAVAAATTQSTAMVTQKLKATKSVKSGGKTVTAHKKS